jgi:membrane-associated HD superfamily phosphohydrolase
MEKRFLKAALFIAGGYLLWYLISAFQASARKDDRHFAIQVPLFLLVLAAPVLSLAIRNRRPWLPTVLLVTQIALYVLYETGVSSEVNIRVDLLFAYPAILLNAWMAIRAASLNASDSTQSVVTLNAVPSDRTKCDLCGVDYPSSYYLTAGSRGGYICDDCARKQ